MRSPGQITEHKTALAALAAERGTSLHSRRELERLQVQMHTDRAGREALLERFRRSNEEAGREMISSGRRRKSCGPDAAS